MADNQANTLIQYIQQELINIVDSIVIFTVDDTQDLYKIYACIGLVLNYIEISFHDNLISQSEHEYYTEYFTFLKLLLDFIRINMVRAPSGALTLEKNFFEFLIKQLITKTTNTKNNLNK